MATENKTLIKPYMLDNVIDKMKIIYFNEEYNESNK